MVSTFATYTLSLAVVPLILNRTSIGTYGQWATLLGISAILGLVESGTSTEVARRVAELEGAGKRAEAKQAVQKALSVILTLSAIAGALSVIVAVWVLPHLFTEANADEMRTLRLVWIAVIALQLAGFVLGTWFATLSGLQRSDFGAYSGVVGSLVGTATVAVFISTGAGIWSLLAGSLARILVAWVGPVRGMRLLRPEVRLRPQRATLAEAFTMLGASSFMVISASAQLADKQVDKIVLTRLHGPDVAGVFQLGVSLAQQPAVAATLPAALLMAATAELTNSDPGKLRRLRRATEAASCALGFLIAGGIFVFASDFVGLWLGPGYDAVADVARVLAIAAIPAVVAIPWYFYAMGRAWRPVLVATASTSLLLNLVGTVALTPRFGAVGAAYGSLLGATGALIVYVVLLRQRGDQASLLHTWRPGLVTGVGALAGVLWLPTATTWWAFGLLGLGWTICVASALLGVGAFAVRVVRKPRGLGLELRTEFASDSRL